MLSASLTACSFRSEDELRRGVSVRRFCPARKSCSSTDDLAEKALSLYRDRFGDIGLFENAIYPGIEETSSTLAGSGRRMFVATSKPHVYAERIIDHFGLRGYFERVFGSELDGLRCDKTELLDYALQQAKVDPLRAIMIGDRSHDMIGARNNRMTALGVLYGYGSKAELVGAGAHQGLCASVLAACSSTPISSCMQSFVSSCPVAGAAPRWPKFPRHRHG